jgi:predicted Zn-dependent protease
MRLFFMTTNKKSLPAEPQDKAKNDGVAAELSDEAIHNLTGFFDVLIQMDFALKQRNERGKENDDFLQGTTSEPKQAD